VAPQELSEEAAAIAEQRVQRESLVASDEEYVGQGSTTGCDGTATKNSVAVVHGRFIWEHTTEDRAMYLANNGYWKVSTKANARAGEATLTRRTALHLWILGIGRRQSTRCGQIGV
jgi:hypothetical protein